MLKIFSTGTVMIVAGAAFLLTGCASTEDVQHAQSTADTALSTAQQAQQTANSAQSAAAAAQQSADQARSDVNALDQKISAGHRGQRG